MNETSHEQLGHVDKRVAVIIFRQFMASVLIHINRILSFWSKYNKRVENLNFCFIGYKKDKKLQQLSPYWQVRRETVKRETAKSDRLYRLASSICHIILERMEVLSSNQSNLFLTLLIFSITDIIWYFISSLCSCRLSEYNGFQQESSCYLGHCTQIKCLLV